MKRYITEIIVRPYQSVTTHQSSFFFFKFVVDILVKETSTTPIDHSLQRVIGAAMWTGPLLRTPGMENKGTNTLSPTRTPSTSPTKAPTKSPTIAPTKAPTKSPTLAPTKVSTIRVSAISCQNFFSCFRVS